MKRSLTRLLLALLLCLACLGHGGALAEEAPDAAVWDLSAADRAELERRFLEAEQHPELKSIVLGKGEADDGRVPWEALARLRAARPELSVDYSFRLFHVHATLEDEVLDLNHRKMEDQGALVRQVIACMPRLQKLDMDSCRVDDEHMAALRDDFPEIEVVWRIWFGDSHGGRAGYSVRTDVERILASNPGIGGELTPENTLPLQYCTKVKYLDLGHNSYLGSIDFIRYMPELELLIVAMGDWSDLSPIACCPKLTYAEIQTSALNDLRPLTGLKNLRHLNICYCFALHDMSPLFEMPWLERLWIGCLTPIPPEQIETFRALAPDCVVNTTTENPTEEGWRRIGYNDWGAILDPTYEWVREKMHYSWGDGAYAYPYNDPLYYRSGG